MYFYSQKLAIALKILIFEAVSQPIKPPKTTLTIPNYDNNDILVPIVSLNTIIYVNIIVFHKKLPNFG